MALTDEKFAQKQTLLIERTAKALHIDTEQATALLRNDRRQSLRINTLQSTLLEVCSQLDSLNVSYSVVPWARDGLFIHEGLKTIRDHAIAEKGDVYIQNAASWLPVLAL